MKDRFAGFTFCVALRKVDCLRAEAKDACNAIVKTGELSKNRSGQRCISYYPLKDLNVVLCDRILGWRIQKLS